MSDAEDARYAANYEDPQLAPVGASLRQWSLFHPPWTGPIVWQRRISPD